MTKAIRVLQVATIMNRGGLETMLMNYYRNIDRSRIQFDFMLHRPERGAYDDEIEALGGKIYRMPPIHPKNFFGGEGYFKTLDMFYKRHKEYSIVHSHLESLSTFVLRYAKRNGVPVRIAHSHSTDLYGGGLKRVFKLYSRAKLDKECTDLFACGEDAGVFLFKKAIAKGRNFIIMKNAIETDRFKFDAAIRRKIREQFNLEGKFVVGHAGRFDEQKNHDFLIDIFCHIQKTEPNSALLLIGDGQLKERIIDKTERLGIRDKVVFTGSIANVNEAMMAMDFFLMPSLYEGLSIVCVEAQASGLPVIASSNIPAEAKVTELMTRLDLQDGAAFWAESLMRRALSYRGSPRCETANDAVRRRYGIEENAGWLQEFYLRKVSE